MNAVVETANLSFVASPEDLYAWSERVMDSRTSLQQAARAPNNVRQYRSLRVDEVVRFSGVSRRRCVEWALANNLAKGDRPAVRGFSVEQMHRMMDELEVRPSRPKNKSALRLLISNFKGGAQKTTVALQLVHYFGLRGYRVLVLQSIRRADTNSVSSIGRVTNQPHREFIKTHIDGVDLLPANLGLTAMDFHIAKIFVHEPEAARRYPNRMDEALRAIEDQYDLILIDSPPAFSFMAICMGWIADGVIVPMPTQVPDYAGTGDFCEMLATYTEQVEEWYEQKKHWAPFAFVHARVAGGLGSDLVHARAGGAFGHYRLGEVVPESRPISNCLTVFKSVFEATSVDTDSKGLIRAREAYMALCERVESLLSEGWANKPEIADEHAA